MSRRRSPMPAFATSVLTQTVQRRMQLALWPGPRSLQVLYSSCHLCYSNPISIAGSLSRAIRMVGYFRGPRSIQDNNHSKRLQTSELKAQFYYFGLSYDYSRMIARAVGAHVTRAGNGDGVPRRRPRQAKFVTCYFFFPCFESLHGQCSAVKRRRICQT